MNKITYLCIVFLLSFSFKGSSQTSEIQRVRLDFVGPSGYTRHLLLAFTPNGEATDGIDYGYDAPNFENLPDDLNWIIENERYIIQGVGAFNTNKYYPFGMFLSNSGEVQIALTALENFETDINVFIYDATLNTFTSINNSNYIKTLAYGEYLDRFYVTFTNNSEIINIPSEYNATLSICEHGNEYENVYDHEHGNGNGINNTTFKYHNWTKELFIETNSKIKFREITFYDELGKKLLGFQNINSNNIKIPLSRIKTNGTFIVCLKTDDGKQLNKHIITSR